MRFSRNVFRLSYACHAFLSECLACGSIQMSCVRSAPVIRSSRNVLRSITPAVCRLCAKQDGLRDVPFLFRRGSGSPVARSRIVGTVIGLCGFTSGLRVSLWRSRRRTKGRGNAENGGNGERSRRRGGRAFLRDHIGFAAFSAGSPLGAARPQTCAKEPLALWTLFIWVAVWVRFARRGGLAYNAGLSGSNKRRPRKAAQPPG